MNENTNEPFAIGQKVVALKTVPPPYLMMGYNKGEEFTVACNKIAPKAGSWHTSFVERPPDEFYESRNFAPIQTERIRYVVVAEELKNVPQVKETIDN